jgi:succinyl-CoA synthetase alpha subunit
VDSVSLMSVSSRANDIDGVRQAFVAMGTPMNKEVLRELDLLAPELEQAHNGDLMIVIETGDAGRADAALEELEALLERKPPSSGGQERRHRTLRSAVEDAQDANLAVISVNGMYAAREARQALEAGLHVMLFSDNVALEDEIALKRLAHEHGLLMMGPDCGTAILNGVGLCFANKVRRGTIGIVGASGTGSQEVSVRVHALGGGVSQLIGTGGRDLSQDVGGLMMLDAMSALDADPGTDVVVLVSKPPAPDVQAKVLTAAQQLSKPVVACLLGARDGVSESGSNVTVVKTTKEAAAAAVGLTATPVSREPDGVAAEALQLTRAKLHAEQRYIRGLFCGGTLCDEAMFLALEVHRDVYSNIQPDPERRLGARSASRAHTFLDLGDDEFTSGRPHPMIDPSTRIERLRQEAEDPEVAVVVMDFILGYGAHDDPVGAMLPAIAHARQRASERGRHLEIVGYVLGTDEDRPRLGEQRAKLESAGVTVVSSSTDAGLLARDLVSKGPNS